jgi:thiamine-phosphate pyrophosphorylase
VPPVYAILDADTLGLDRLPAAAAAAVTAGVRWVQLRAKQALDGDLCRAVEACGRALSGSDAMLWINDRADVAAVYRARGLHLGQDDLPPEAARRVVGEHCWIGLSTHDLEQVTEADRDDAVDLIAVGPVFSTRSKSRPDPVVGLDLVSRARTLTTKPLVAIGGIDSETLPSVLAAGADSVAVIGAIGRDDVEKSCRLLLDGARRAPVGGVC